MHDRKRQPTNYIYDHQGNLRPLLIRGLFISLSVSFADSSLRRARSAALAVHRTAIHYRRLRFAYPLHKGALIRMKFGGGI